MPSEHAVTMKRYAAAEEDLERAMQMNTPSYMLRPWLRRIGNLWQACYGDPGDMNNTVCGVARDTPEKAYAAFDKAWTKRDHDRWEAPDV